MASTRIIPEEWEKVRRSQCLPGGCPRVVGNPPGPPKDRHCEVCASGFLDQYWENLLHGPGDAPPQRARRLGRLAERGRHTAGPLIVLPRHRPSPMLWPVEQRRRATGRWRPLLFVLGFCTAIAG